MIDLLPALVFVAGVVISADVLRTGVAITGARGSGKTLLMSRHFVVPFFLSGATSIVVLDPLGTLCRDILGMLVGTSGAFWDRVVYAPLGGLGNRVPTLPLLYRQGSEPLETVATRPIELWLRLNPELKQNPTMGEGALKGFGRDCLLLIAGMGMQGGDAEELIANPMAHTERIRQAVAEHPFALSKPARLFLEELPRMRLDERQRRATALTNKVGRLARNELLAAQYGADGWSIPVEDLEPKQQLHLLDGGGFEKDEEARRTAVAWLFRRYLEHFDSRQPNRNPPTLFLIDELAVLLGNNGSALEDDFERLVQIGRNKAVAVVVARQEANQLSPRMNNLLMQLGTQFYASTSDVEAARLLARSYGGFDPDWLRREEAVWGQDRLGNDYVRDYRPVHYSIAEQEALNAEKWRALPKLTFMCGTARREGELPASLSRVSLRVWEHGPWPDAAHVDEARRRLATHHPTVADVLAGISARQPSTAMLPRLPPPAPIGVVTLVRDDTPSTPLREEAVLPRVSPDGAIPQVVPPVPPTTLPMRRKTRATMPSSQPAPAGGRG